MGWEIESHDDLFDVSKDGRIVRYDEDDLSDAVAIVRRGGGRSYVLIEPDGYRTTYQL